jgi:hypothetical protein
MATEEEIRTKVTQLLDAYSAMLAPSGGSKLLTLDRDAGTDAALSRLRQGGAERWRYGMLAGDDDFVLQWSTDGSELNFVDRLRIDGATGAVEIAGLSLDGASFADTTFTGQSLFAAGSAAAPAIAAAGGVDTGLFFPGANAVGVATAGVERMLIDAAGNTTLSGDVTMGTTNTLVWDTSAGALNMNRSQNYIVANAGDLIVNTFDDFFLRTGASYTTRLAALDTGDILLYLDNGTTEGARWDASAGRLGIGTAFPAYDLDVTGDVRASNQLLVGSSGGSFAGDDNLIKPALGSAYLNIKGGSGRAKIALSNDFIALIAGNSGGSIRFQTGASTSIAGGTLVAQFNADGQFLLGTTVAGASKLVVADDSIQLNNSKTPATAAATGTTGQIAWDASFLYVCTAPDTWKRAAIATW